MPHSPQHPEPCQPADFKHWAGQLMEPTWISTNASVPNLYNVFVPNMVSGYNNFGCQWFQGRKSFWEAQYALLANPGNIYGQRLHAKIMWAIQMHSVCGCSNQLFKMIDSFNLDFSDLPAASETRNFTVLGTNGAVFSLEIQNEDSHYYNFTTKAFQAAKTRLNNAVISNGIYNGSITFPAITDDDQYDVYLFAEQGTEHASYKEVRFGDNTIDINSSTGSNSLLIKKVIYQYTDITLTLSAYAPTAAFTITSLVNDTFALSKGKKSSKVPFTISCTSSSAASFTVLRQPTENDILSFVSPTVGSAPEKLPGENEYPAVSNTDTVDGAVTSGVKVVMDTNVADKMKVGDRITGNAALDAATVTVVALNPDTDNVKEFSMSEEIAIADGLTLSFSNQMNYQWPLDSVNKITPGMLVVPSTNVTASSVVSEYRDVLTVAQDTENERKIIRNQAPAINTKSQTPTVVKGLVTTQPGNVVFNNQQKLALAGDAIKIGGYGTSQILNVHGYVVRFTDLALALTAVTTTTTAASNSSTSVVVAARDGILNTVSTVSGVGIDSSSAAPTVNSGASAAGAGTIVLSAAQTLENGTTLTFPGAGKVATITGNIEVVKAGTADAVLRFDVEKILTSA